jgi:hypothetical protein
MAIIFERESLVRLRIIAIGIVLSLRFISIYSNTSH